MAAPYPEGGPPSSAPVGKTQLGLEPNLGAALCYLANFICCLGLVLAIVFLATEKENRFVKFHALQSILLHVAFMVVGIGLAIIFMIIGIILGVASAAANSSAGGGFAAIFGLLSFLIWIVVLIAYVGGLIMAAVKSYGGAYFKLPVIGNIADKFANK